MTKQATTRRPPEELADDVNRFYEKLRPDLSGQTGHRLVEQHRDQTGNGFVLCLITSGDTP